MGWATTELHLMLSSVAVAKDQSKLPKDNGS
jgi:hypothetical protein